MNTSQDPVQAFYDQLPFNQFSSVRSAARSIERNAIASQYPDLHAWLMESKAQTGIEFGCGAGWLSNTLANHHHMAMTGVDFCRTAVDRARKVAARLNLSPKFEQADLRHYTESMECGFDLVASIGVLHHTDDARRSFDHIQRFLNQDGRLYLGLYHSYGRRPFLDHFARIVHRDGEAAALARYAELDGVRSRDRQHLESWFRDQVLHPHESQHSLAEVAEWIEAAGLQIESTSLNHFEPIEDLDEVLAAEPQFETRSREALEVHDRYFPGFFTVMARRRP